jgi:hypothetical protein
MQRGDVRVEIALPGHKLRRRSRGYRKVSLWLRRRQHRWRDRSLTLLLIVQLITTFGIVPLTASGLRLANGLPLLLLSLFMSVTIVMARGTWAIGAGLGFFVANAALATWRRSHGGFIADILVDLSALFTFGVLSGLVGAAVFRPGRVNSHRVRGALVLYLNLGLLFALLHRMVAEFIPGAYTHLPDPAQAAAFRATLDYYSFSTLTSVGYGDIVPVHPIARSLAALEACAGQLLPTLLIGRVVMLAMRE